MPGNIFIRDQAGNLRSKSNHELESILGVQWQESVTHRQTPYVYSEFTGTGIYTRENLPDIELRHDKRTGWAAFAAQSIKQNEPVAVYAGEVEHLSKAYNPSQTAHTYCYTCKTYPELKTLPHWVNSAKKRNIASYVQYAPPFDILQSDFVFNKDIDINTVGTENLSSLYLDINKPYTVPVYFSIKDIFPGDILLNDYGTSYWAKLNQDYLLFTKQGKVIDRSQYDINSCFITVHNEHLNLPFWRHYYLREMEQLLMDGNNITVSTDEMDCQIGITSDQLQSAYDSKKMFVQEKGLFLGFNHSKSQSPLDGSATTTSEFDPNPKMALS